MPGTSQPKGCLAAILSLFGIQLGPSETKGLPYRLRDDFLSRGEFAFYQALRRAVEGKAIVCPKVNLADIFFVARPNENQSYRNKIDRKHVDFLLCDPTTMQPLAGVELDDSSHARQDRQDRDKFVDQVFKTAGLPLIHVVARSSYDFNAIATQLAPCFGTQAAPPPIKSSGAPLVTSSAIPTCPKCSIPMVERTAGSGPNKGGKFWGCRNYPKCREVAS